MTGATAADRERVGPYQLVKAIGAGGSARIDLARIDRAYGFQRHVVIKRPLEHLRGDAKAAASLQREAKLGGRLRHPNLVTILDAGVHDGYDYLVLEYVHGGSLRTLMQTDSPARVRELPLGVALAIACDVARALHVAHELADDGGAPIGLVHRDVSPGNVLLGLDGAVKLADFGIAKETRVATLSGSMHGTVTYMAPEQCRGHAFDRRADVFSLGVILYELVTGTRLFWADNDVASLHRVLSGTVTRPRKVRPAITATLEEIVMTAVAPDPDRRFANARVLAEALEGHAAASNELLGARWIARWVREVLGPREVPWIAAATMTDPAPRGDGSLVALIEAAPADDEPPPESFGPTGELAFDEGTETERAREPRWPRRRRRALLGALIATGLAGATAATAIVMTRAADAPAPAAVPARDVSPPPVLDRVPDPIGESPSSVEPAPPRVIVPEEIERAPDPKRRPRAKERRRRRAATPPPEPTGSAGSSAPAIPPRASSTGPASRTVRSKAPKVEWKPTMLWPTDSGSGSRK